MNTPGLTRRHFLAGLGATGAAALLSGCATSVSGNTGQTTGAVTVESNLSSPQAKVAMQALIAAYDRRGGTQATLNTERGDAPWLDLDGAHVRNYLRLLDFLRAAHPGVLVEGCASGGGRVDLATIARTDVVWPSDNTGPTDRLAIQHGFLHAHAPHIISSWVTDSPGFFDTRPRSLAFRFVTAMAGVLGIGADILAWSAEERAEAARFVALYKEIRAVIQRGTVDVIGTPRDRCHAVQYTTPDRIVVLAWHTGEQAGPPALPGRTDRFPLCGLDSGAEYRTGDGRYSGAHLMSAGLPVTWRTDADVVVLDRA